MLDQFLSGASTMGFLTVFLFFLRFWQKTRDRLFIFFAAAFGFMMLERIVRSAWTPDSEFEPYVYMLRLISFLLIIAAIVDKNRRAT